MSLAKENASWGFASLAIASLAVFLLLIGATLFVGGIWLIALGGARFYALAGAGLMASGFLTMRRRMEGAWVYAATFLVTLLWSFAEVGLNGWALIPRLVGPFILLLLMILALPTLDRERGAKRRNGALIGYSIATVLLLIAVGYANRAPAPGAMPHPPPATMVDPALMQTGVDWPAYGGTNSARRYSPANQINRQNVGSLARAWTFRTGEVLHYRWGAETTPLKIGDTLYLCTGMNQVIALDAATGRQKWRFNPHVSNANIPYTAACRGIAYYDTHRANDSCGARIIAGTLDGRLLALSAQTGALCTDFGDRGEVDITKNMGRVDPGMVSITSAPTIVRGVIITGHQVLDGQTLDAPSGVILGYDAVTGALKWAWDPGDPHSHSGTFTRGTPNMWTTASGDESLGLVYLPLGNAAVDYLSQHRSDDENQFSTSLVALNVRTGKPVWHFQAVHRDVWDYDLGSQATLIDFPTNRGVVPALVLPSKPGDLYVLDRRTGAPLTGVEERRAPGGGQEPQSRSPTQPHSRFHTLAQRALTERDMWGMSLIDQMICRIQFREAFYDGIYTPPSSSRPWIEYPGSDGGSDWGGVAVDPQRGVIIANYSDMPNYNRLIPRVEADRRGPVRGREPQAGAPFAVQVNSGWRMPGTAMPCKQPPYGGIRAIDIATGRTIWDRPLGTARHNGIRNIPSGLPFDIGTPNNGGAVISAGGVVFIAAATDDLIRAIDIETGKTLWQDVLPAGGQATPMIYEIGGREFLVISATGHHFMETPPGDYIIAYALPGR